jgi:hypothetical protein
MLPLGGGHLHSSCSSDGRVGDVAITCNLIGSVHHNNPFLKLVAQYPSYFPKLCGFSHSWRSKEQDVLSGNDDITDNIDCAVYGAPYSQRQTHNIPQAISNTGYAMERSFDSRSIVSGESTNSLNHMVDVFPFYNPIRKNGKPPTKANLGRAPKIHHDLNEIVGIFLFLQSLADVTRKDLKELIQVVNNTLKLFTHIYSFASLLNPLREKPMMCRFISAIITEEGLSYLFTQRYNGKK